LHSVGLTHTKHENAEILRKGWGAQGGVVVTDELGEPIDVDQLSDDEVIALDKQRRGSPIGRPLAGSAAAAAVAAALSDSAMGIIIGCGTRRTPDAVKQTEAVTQSLT